MSSAPSAQLPSAASGQSSKPVEAPLAALRAQLVIRRQSLRQVARRGLKVRVRCSAACGLSSSVVASSRTARQLGIGSASTTLGRAQRQFTNAGVHTLTMRVSRRTLAGLRARRVVRLSVRLVASDASGKLTTQTKTVTLKR